MLRRRGGRLLGRRWLLLLPLMLAALGLLGPRRGDVVHAQIGDHLAEVLGGVAKLGADG
jgi:hypothetical protein